MDASFSMFLPFSVWMWNVLGMSTLMTTAVFGQNLSSVLLTLTTPGGYVQLDAVMKNVTKYEGETLRIKCEITGYPLPRYAWFKDGVPLDKLPVSSNHYTAKITPWGSRLKIEEMTTDDSGVYTCVGSNNFGRQLTNGTLTIKPGSNPNKDWLTDLDGDGEDADPFDMESDLPQLNENPDHHFLDEVGTGKRTGHGSKGNSPKRKPDHVKQSSEQDDGGGRDGYCQPYRGAACARFVGNKSVYVRSNTQLGNVEETMTARLTMIATTSEISPRCAEVAIPALCHSAFPLCDSSSSSRRSRPRKVCLDDCEAIEKTLCKNEYRTERLKTKSDHGFILPKCLELSDTNENCVHLDTDGSVISDKNYESGVDDDHRKMNPTLHIIIPCLTIPICIGILIVIMCLYRRCRSGKTTGKQASKKGSEDSEAMLMRPSLRVHDYPIASVRFLQELGEGVFGKVCRGELIQYAENTIVPVVVKTLRPNSAERQFDGFWSEAERAGDLKHANVTKLVGVCSKDQPFCAIYEYFIFGDLHEYLIVHSPNSDISFSDPCGRERVLADVDMIRIAVQIASGMEYLSGRGIVHGDVAARNMLVGEGAVVKISDLGISRNAYPLDYYVPPGMSASVPVRWMPPEAIQYGKYSAASDAWSYGVTLWEVYSYGLQPYYGHSNQDIVQMIQIHQTTLLPCPKDCAPFVYSAMTECWQTAPAHRPTFHDIHRRLWQWQTENVNVGHHPHHHHHHLACNVGHCSQQSSSTGTSNNTGSTMLPSHALQTNGGYDPSGVRCQRPNYGMLSARADADRLQPAETMQPETGSLPAMQNKKSSSSASSASQKSSSNHSSQSPLSSVAKNRSKPGVRGHPSSNEKNHQNV